MLPQGNTKLYLLLFSLAFFAAVLFFALRPGKILVWVGKVLNPCFLLFLAVLIVSAMLHPTAAVADVVPEGKYAAQPFFTGFLEGYNTMDALASLAFGIIVVQVIRDLGVQEPGAIAGSTVRAGVMSCLLMALIYVAVAIVGAQSRGALPAAANGGVAFAQIARYYLGNTGLIVLAATVTLACLKTAVGLITGCAETFSALFKNGPSYKAWAITFSAVSFVFANLGLDAIIKYSVPVLMLLHPIAIMLIVLTLCGGLFKNDPVVFRWTITFTAIAAIYDMFAALPKGLWSALHGEEIKAVAEKLLPLAGQGLGWLCPAALGLVIGLAIHVYRLRKA